ncbi:MAG: 5'/3'-nucleotidase SurE [Lachnospiraceae bacterium]|nr:5'/3'-nucleotidase SurE [Lachnospiraceae bacterium]
MRFLIVNDDGIQADGIRRLAMTAAKLGEVWVIAPSSQRSAASQSITLSKPFLVSEYDFGGPIKKAYSVDGTPADCVRMGLDILMDERPDFILSGVNNGLNTGYDCGYSGTDGAAMEGLFSGVQAMAFSTQSDMPHEAEDKYMLQILKELVDNPAPKGAIWNVNFPGGLIGDCKGVKYDRKVGDTHIFIDHYRKLDDLPGGFMVEAYGTPVAKEELPEDSDIYAVRNGYVSVGPLYAVSAR